MPTEPPVLRLRVGYVMDHTARALRARFEQICQSELHRLRRKTSMLSPDARAEVAAISLAVAHAISAPVEEVLQHEQGHDLHQIVSRLFGIDGRDVPKSVNRCERTPEVRS